MGEELRKARSKLDVVVVEDDASAREALRKALSRDGHRVRTAATFAEGRAAAGSPADLALCDVKLPDGDGTELVLPFRAAGVSVIVMTAYGSIETAVKAIKDGAEDFLEKPIDLDRLRLAINRVADTRDLRSENSRLKDALGKKYRFENIIGSSPAMQEVFQVVEQVAPTRATVLILGESGTGKELIANAIHHRSGRAAGPLVKVNCAALTETLLESELFGHEKGSFTGAFQTRKGRFEIADGGTLFLDEIADIPHTTQVKILRALQEHTFERVGGNVTLSTDVRIITATNADLEKAVKEGKVREDLYYRLKVVTIVLPPLRNRPEDIPALAAHFARKFSSENAKPELAITPATLAALESYHWPGNVRELENVIESAVVMAKGGELTPDLLVKSSLRPPAASDPSLRFPLGTPLADVERRMIVETLKSEDGNKTRAAKALRIGVRTLYRKLAEYGIA